MEWVSSTVFFPTVRPSTWLGVSLPIPSFDHRQKRRNALCEAVPSGPVAIVIHQRTNYCHVIKIDLSEQQYDQDIVKALGKVYSEHQGYWWRWLYSTHKLRISYMKASSFAQYQ